MIEVTIRPACLQPYSEAWLCPSGAELREVLRRAGLNGKMAAKLVGVSSSRQLRRWKSEESEIPYAAWAILCDAAGITKIWVERQERKLVQPEAQNFSG